MEIGIPREIKPDEHRVGVTPSGVRELVARGHNVRIETTAGVGAQIGDEDYAKEGASIVPSAEEAFAAELVVKVKEPLAAEVGLLGPGQTLFTYLHLAPNEELTRGLAGSGATCIAYEIVEGADGSLPLLAPMSEIAGRIATQDGAKALESPQGGRGTLLSGSAGVKPGVVVVIGGGVVGSNAAAIAVGMRATVYVLDRDLNRLRALDGTFQGQLTTTFSTAVAVEDLLPQADLVIGAVLIKGARAPHVLSREQLKLMKPGAVLVDVAIDQGGCFETSRPTTHSDPIYEVDGINHYCVANMPGAVPVTSTEALANATFPYLLDLAEKGVARALSEAPGLASGLSLAGGRVTSRSIAEAFGLSWVQTTEAVDAIPV